MSLIDPHPDAGDVDEGKKVSGGLLIASPQAAEAFESMEEFLDQVAKTEELPVLGQRSGPLRLRRDDWLQAEELEQVAKPIRVVARVGNAGGSNGMEQKVVGFRQLVPLPRGELDVSGSSLSVDEGMNLRRKTSSRVSQSIVLDPPFPPAASRCARTVVPSRIEASGRGTGGSGSTCTSLKSRSQMPRFDQLLNRLYTDFHLPYRRGKSRQGQPVRVSQYTALMNRRSPLSERRPRLGGRSGSSRAHSLSVSSCRCIPSVDQILIFRATSISTRRPKPEKPAREKTMRSELSPFRDTP